MQRLVAVGLLAAILANDGPSQAPEVRTSLGLAQTARDENPEQACALLQRAWLLAGLVDDDRERRQLQGQAADMLREIDRSGIQTVRTLDKMLEDLRKFATAHSARGWYESADYMLRAAEVLLPEAVAEDMRTLQQRRADLAPKNEELVSRKENELLQEWFRDGEMPYKETPWSLDDAGLRSPPCEGRGFESTMMLLSSRRFEGGGRIRFHVRMGALGTVGFAFALTPNGTEPSYHLFSVFYRKSGTVVSTYSVAGIEATPIQTESIPFTLPQQRGWLEVEVVMIGNTAVLRAGPQQKPLTLYLPNGTDGHLGFYVTGDSRLVDPVHVRSLTLERFAPYSSQ